MENLYEYLIGGKKIGKKGLSFDGLVEGDKIYCYTFSPDGDELDKRELTVMDTPFIEKDSVTIYCGEGNDARNIYCKHPKDSVMVIKMKLDGSAFYKYKFTYNAYSTHEIDFGDIKHKIK